MSNFNSAEAWYLSVISGRRRGAMASLARGVFSAAEPLYTAGVHARNFLYTRRVLTAAHARRPVVSVGNVTTGGTGKTPIVAWLVHQLRVAGRSPAVLLRGYRSNGGVSDEELLLRELVAPSPVRAQADRFAGSEHVLAEHPEIDAFVLDDGLQHRQLARYFSIVLVDATSPFGFGHVLPRGLLREPMRGFRRANAVVITRADLVGPAALREIEERVRSEQPEVPMFRCDLKQDRLVSAAGDSVPTETLRGQRVFAFCGIGNPGAFFLQIKSSGAELVATRQFRDHHPYSSVEVSTVFEEAKNVGATTVLTTEKDWVKIARLSERSQKSPPLLRVGISVEIQNQGGPRLVQLVMEGIAEGDRLLGWKK